MKTLHFFSCRDIKMTIMTSYFQIRDVFKFLFLISQDFYPSYILTKFEHHLTRVKKFGKFASLIMFLTKHSLINWLPWQQ